MPAAPASCSDYLFINLLIAPYYPPGEAGGGGHRRRLLAAAESRLVGEALSMRGANGSRDPAVPAHSPQLVAAKAEEELERRVTKLLARPKLTLAQRQPARRQHRRLLTDESAEEPPNVPGEVELPQLKVRRRASRAVVGLGECKQELWLGGQTCVACFCRNGCELLCVTLSRAARPRCKPPAGDRRAAQRQRGAAGRRRQRLSHGAGGCGGCPPLLPRLRAPVLLNQGRRRRQVLHGVPGRRPDGGAGGGAAAVPGL